MPFDTMPVAPQPVPDRLMALKNLAWLLRHPEPLAGGVCVGVYGS